MRNYNADAWTGYQKFRRRPGAARLQAWRLLAASNAFVNVFWNGESPLVQYRTQHSDVSSLQTMDHVPAGVAPGRVRFQNNDHTVCQTSQHNSVVRSFQGRNIQQKIVKLAA